MSGGGGIIIITGRNADGSTTDGSPISVSAGVFKALWEAIPASAHSSQPAQAAYNSVDALVNSVT